MLPADDDGQSLWSTIDDRLRGRWKWMAILGVVLAAAAGVAAWHSTVPEYESVGVIRVTPQVSVTLEEVPEAEVAKFSMFVNTQVQLIRSRRVLENAMADPQVKADPWASEEDALIRLEEELGVEPGRDSELIYVSFSAESPKLAQAVVNAVIRSYDDIYGQAGGLAIGETLEKLRGVESQFQRQLNQVRSDLSRTRRRYGGTDLMQMHAARLEETELVTELIGQIEEALAGQSSPDAMPFGDDVAVTPMLEELEPLEPRLVGLRRTRDAARTELDIVEQRYREGTAAHRSALGRFEVADRVYQEAVLEAAAHWQTQPGGLQLEAESLAGLSPERLRERLESLREREAELRAETQQLIADLPVVTDLRAGEQRIIEDLGRTRRRIQGLALEEQNIAGRIIVEQEGFRPTQPSRDRRIRRAAMGAVGGFCLSFGVFFMWGTIDRRAFGAKQLSDSTQTLPVLGVLPDLGRDLADRDSSEVASHCVHQIRNQIEAMRPPADGFVLGMTSPFQGDGKTSIVLAMGWSYATAGYRTLLIDCDLVGRSLTRQLGMVGRPGLREALTDGQMSGLITSPAERLDALPVGADGRFGPESVRKIDLTRLLASVRDRYDVIIVDTGPVLGSLECTPVCAAADAVVLTVRRGRSRSRLEETRERLAAVNANVLGLILNWAARSDCHRYVAEVSRPSPGVAPSTNEASIIRGGNRSALMAAMEEASQASQTDEHGS